MDSKKKKRGCLKIKITNLIIILALFVGGCAVPFETAGTKNVGEPEFIVGYTAPLTFTAKSDIGVTGYTDLGIGLDMAGLFLGNDPVLCFYGTGKQKILSFGKNPHFNLLVSATCGIVASDLNPENIPYYRYTLLLGIKDGKNSNIGLVFGIGFMQDPRYSWEIMHEEFSEETHLHTVMGAENKKFIFQIQTAFKGEDSDRDRDGLISFGFGFKL